MTPSRPPGEALEAVRAQIEGACERGWASHVVVELDGARALLAALVERDRAVTALREARDRAATAKADLLRIPMRFSPDSTKCAQSLDHLIARLDAALPEVVQIPGASSPGENEGEPREQIVEWAPVLNGVLVDEWSPMPTPEPTRALREWSKSRCEVIETATFAYRTVTYGPITAPASTPISHPEG